MRKKTISAFLMLALVITCFSACATDKPAGTSTSPSQAVGNTDSAKITATHPQTTEPITEKPTEGITTTLPPDKSGQKLVALTFDDGPGPYTKQLIEGLNQRGVKATFFMLGQKAAEYGDTIKFMYESGHQLGSHTYSHKDITKISNEEFLSEMQRTDDAIKAGSGGSVATAFRPPYGAFNQEKLNLQDKTPTHWSIDTMDWKTKNAESVKQHIITHVKDGSIVLMHDIYETSVQGSLAAIDELLTQGYKFVTVNELVTRNGDPITPHDIYFSCVPKKAE